MSDELDAIERELEAMTPNTPSPQLQARIGRRIDAPRHVPGHRWLVPLGLAAAACLAILLVQWRVGRETTQQAPSVRPSHPVDVTQAHPSAPAPLREYELALAQSPASLDAVLDAQANTPTRSSEQAIVRAFSPSDLNAFLSH